MPTNMSRLKGFRFPREIIAYTVWAYHRFALSTADVEDLLAGRGVNVSREAIRLWLIVLVLIFWIVFGGTGHNRTIDGMWMRS